MNNFTLRADVLSHRLLGLVISISVAKVLFQRTFAKNSSFLLSRLKNNKSQELCGLGPMLLKAFPRCQFPTHPHNYLITLGVINLSLAKVLFQRTSAEKLLRCLSTDTFRIFRSHWYILNQSCVLRTLNAFAFVPRHISRLLEIILYVVGD